MVFISIYVKKDLCLKKLPPYFLFSIILYLWSEQVCENTCFCLVFGVFSSCIWSKVSGKALAFRLCTIIKGFFNYTLLLKRDFLYFLTNDQIHTQSDRWYKNRFAIPPLSLDDKSWKLKNCTLSVYVNRMTTSTASTAA